MVIKIVFLGTKSKYVSSILANKINHADYMHIYGIGSYFTDSIDYTWFWGDEVENYEEKYKNIGKIPRVKEDSFSFIAAEIYYDRT